MELTKTNAVLSRLKGYKHTEIGPIPSDWEVKCLGDLGQFLKGKGIKKDEVVPDGMPCVRYGELYTVYSNKIERTVSFINESTSKESIQLRYGDLLFAGSGETKEEIGKSAVILRNDTYAGGDIVIFRTKDIDFHFLGYLSNFTPIQKQKSLNGQGDAVVHIYSGGLSKVKIPLPPTLTEQKAIATALSDVDSLISSLDKLIIKKKAIKQGAMQQLLTPPNQGGKRLPGFIGDWVEIELIEKYTFLNGKPYENKLDSSGEYFLITLDSVNIEGNLKANHKRVDFYDNSLIEGDLVTVLSDIAHAKLLGLSGYIPENKKYVLNQRMGRLRFDNDIDPQFARYQINYHQEYFKNRGQGSSQRHIYKKDFDEFILKYPKKNEQQQIVEILNDLQAEINTLISKKSKLLNLKQGMMQELLTGKTRLV